MRKILTDLVKVFIFILIMYLPLSLFNLRQDTKRLEERENAYRAKRLEYTRDIVSDYMTKGRFLEACLLLNAEHGARSLTAFHLEAKGDICKNDDFDSEFLKINTKNQILPTTNEKEERYVASFESAQFKYAMVTEPYKVRLWNNPDAKIETTLWFAIIKDLGASIYTLFLFTALAVLVLSRSIQNRFKKDGVDPFWFRILNKMFGWLQLGDLKIIRSAINAMIRKHEEVVKDVDLLETSLEHSILNEIKNKNRALPYKFMGAVAKVDINGFSKVVSAGHSGTSQSMSTNLEEFGCELLVRYRGLFEKTVGDEIVVVFQSEDALAMAAAFARDLMTEFSSISFDIEQQRLNFTLKSSIYKSEITFAKRPSGYGFFGDALTYTTRLLDVIKDRDRNILSVLRSQVNEIQDLVLIPSEMKKFEFKNMTAQEGFLIDSFLSFEEAYIRNPQLIRYFRSDDAICKMFDKLKIEADPKKIDIIFKTMNDTVVRSAKPLVVEAYIRSLKIFEKRTMENPGLSFAFSRLIIEGSRLIPNKDWTKECTDAVISISRYIEGRINASVVDVLIEKDLNQIAIEQEKTFILDKDTSFRTRGNLLISEAKMTLSDEIFERVIKMIKSANKLESATGIYCACRIIIDSRRTNPAELETFMSYRKLSKILLDLQQSKPDQVSDRLLKLLDQVNVYNELTY